MRTMGELESAIMDFMWSLGKPATVREVLSLMGREPPLAYTTVMTVMNNLHRKGFLTRVKQGRAFQYQPSKHRAEYTAEMMDELLVSSGDRSTTLLRFVSHMTPEQVAELRGVLEQEPG